jgi:tRNA threonylcarbamoyladenosine biosynthesis protein TsaB
MTTLLAFDTATERISIGLERDDAMWLHEGEGGAAASARFLPAVLDLLDQAGVGLDELDAIAYGRGPGAFTGLRTACSAAQGLAYGARKRVIAIDTLLAVAEDARAGADAVRIWVLQDARMDEVYAAEYVHDAGGWRTEVAPLVTSPEKLVERWRERPPEVVAGNALVAYGSRLDSGLARRVPEAAPRPEALLALARAAWLAGRTLEATEALPLYIRDKVAQTTAEREAGR